MPLFITNANLELIDSLDFFYSSVSVVGIPCVTGDTRRTDFLMATILTISECALIMGAAAVNVGDSRTRLCSGSTDGTSEEKEKKEKNSSRVGSGAKFAQ